MKKTKPYNHKKENRKVIRAFANREKGESDLLKSDGVALSQWESGGYKIVASWSQATAGKMHYHGGLSGPLYKYLKNHLPPMLWAEPPRVKDKEIIQAFLAQLPSLRGECLVSDGHSLRKGKDPERPIAYWRDGKIYYVGGERIPHSLYLRLHKLVPDALWAREKDAVK